MAKVEKGAYDDRDAYLELVQAFPLKPIRSDEELEEACRVLDKLLDREQLGSDEEDYISVLGDLIAKYEQEHHAIAPSSDRDVLEHLMEARGLTQDQLAKETGIVFTTISAIINDRRALTRDHIARLCRVFHVSPELFSYGSDATSVNG